MKRIVMIFACAVLTAGTALGAASAKSEMAAVNAEMEKRSKEFSAALKTNGLAAAAACADTLIDLAARVGSDGKTKPRYGADWVFGRTILPGFMGKKLSAADHVKRYCERYAAVLKREGRVEAFDAAMKRIDFFWTYALAPSDALRREADAALEDELAHPERVSARDRDAAPFRRLAARAALFGGADRDAFRARADTLAGSDVAKRLLFHNAFPSSDAVLKDPALNDVVRGTALWKLLDKASFADKEALLERALKTPGLAADRKAALLENLVALERSAFPRNWIGETPKRFNGVFTVSHADPVAYAKAVAAQKELVALVPDDEASRPLLMKRLLELMSINYAALNTADVRETSVALAQRLPMLREQWDVKETGYLAASAYYDEDYERAYELFHRHAVADYKGKDRATTQWWYAIAEPYVRTCIAMAQYDEAYLLSGEITNGMIDGWEYWHRAQYKSMFAELAKLCKPETLEAVKAAGKKK